MSSDEGAIRIENTVKLRPDTKAAKDAAAADPEVRLAAVNQALAERDVQIRDLVNALNERDIKIVQLNELIVQRDGLISHLYSSTSWRLTRPIRNLKGNLAAVKSAVRHLARTAYTKAPFSMSVKLQIKSYVFRLLRPFIKRTNVYNAWLAFEEKVRGESLAGSSDAVIELFSAPYPIQENYTFSVRNVAITSRKREYIVPHIPGGKRLICVSHVVPFPPRAGNEILIHQRLLWLSRQGFDIVLVISPLPEDKIGREQLSVLCSVYENVIVCENDGNLSYSLGFACDWLKEMDGLPVAQGYETFGIKVEDNLPSGKLYGIERAFCPDALIVLIAAAEKFYSPVAILVNYVFMTRCFSGLVTSAVKIIETHDVFSTKLEKVTRFGISDALVLSPEEEAFLLKRADLIIAIQPDEKRDISRIVPDKPVVVAGLAFEPQPYTQPASERRSILYVASDNAMNVKGLEDFLRFAWPIISRTVSDVELVVAGKVGQSVEVPDPRVKLLGVVGDLRMLYEQATVTINPAVAGTGLKIKTIEAISYLRPIVTWPAGVDGIAATLQRFCLVSTDWFQFASNVLSVLEESERFQVTQDDAEAIANTLSAETTYSAMTNAIYELCERRGF